jgi:hypothetical protein
MYNEERVPQINQYETSAIRHTIGGGTMVSMLRSGKLFIFGAATSNAGYGSFFLIRDVNMSDDEEYILLPPLDDDFLIGRDLNTQVEAIGYNENVYTRVK